MNHGWPNIGHDCIVRAVEDFVFDIEAFLKPAGMSVRVLSYDVRRSRVLPEHPGSRFQLYIGSGGPGHIDPARNDGRAEYSQGITEDPSWRKPLFALFDAIRANSESALLGVCHTFGLMCVWVELAAPVFRGPGKGGKSVGLKDNRLTDEAIAHPFFQKLSRRLADGRTFKVMDSRLFDLIPAGIPPGALSFESGGDAVTMIEFAREHGSAMPRMLAVNHHPEIGGFDSQKAVLDAKLERGEVTQEWYDERLQTVVNAMADPERRQQFEMAAQFTFHIPLRFHLARIVRQRMHAVGFKPRFHEDQLLDV